MYNLLPYVTIRTFLSIAADSNGASAFIPSGTKYINKVVASSNDIFNTLSWYIITRSENPSLSTFSIARKYNPFEYSIPIALKVLTRRHAYLYNIYYT